MKKLIFSTCVLYFLVTVTLCAEIKLNPLFTDNMVLQRNQKVLIYGSAENENSVTVEFNGQSMTTEVIAGEWRLSLKPMSAGGPYKMIIKGQRNVELKNILIGDVWVLAGQSNMARPFRTYSYLMKQLPNLEMNPRIRWFKIANNTASEEPSKNVVVEPKFQDSWQTGSKELLPYFSPAGYFFAINRVKQNNIPIGLVFAARGATRAESWVSKETLKSKIEYSHILDRSKNKNYKSVKGKFNVLQPAALYNGTVYPVMPFTIKGVLWYQGESDSRNSETYRSLFPDLIRSWRKDWGQGDFPFIFVQLSSYQARSWSLVKGEAWAWQREAQTYGLKEPNTGMIATYDAGEYLDIHPQNKEIVGKRLALMAASMAGENVNASGPRYKSKEIKENKIIISFDKLNGGLQTKEVRMNKNKGIAPGEDSEAYIAPASKLVGFTICGKDKVFHQAIAKIEGDKVIISSTKVKNPIAVRYAWSTFALANLYNKVGLPAYPFRTDNFTPPKLAK